MAWRRGVAAWHGNAGCSNFVVIARAENTMRAVHDHLASKQASMMRVVGGERAKLREVAWVTRDINGIYAGGRGAEAGRALSGNDGAPMYIIS